MMKKWLILFILAAPAFSCNNKTGEQVPVTDHEVARAFVRDLLDNKFNEAEQFLLKDETNMQMFERFKAQYNKQDKDILQRYKESDIIVHETNYVVADSIFIYKYSNSFKPANKSVLKLVRIDGKWLVDLKYTFSGNL
ncbi:MAG TPA: hypothetical protein VHL77_13450 [Ferruginibacter sp.]|jgi:hypothetical protein|nr:hypothetical protein [Ferruginibacter sp.]